MLWASINYSNNGAYFVLFLLSSSVLTSAVMGWRNVRSLNLHASNEAHTFAGSELRFPLIVSHTGSHLSESIRVEVEGFPLLEPYELIQEILPNQESSHLVACPANKRGVYTIKTFKITSVYPLGFWQFTREFPVDLKVWVFPRPDGDQPWPEELEVDESHQDEFSSHSGDHFAGHRSYNKGESQRHIDWKAYSRGKGLLIKDYRGGGTGCVRFDFTQMPGWDTERKLSQLTQWIGQAYRENVEYVLALPGAQLGPARGKGHYDASLHAMASFQNPETHETTDSEN
ncbi:MAG: DUF58 domain-containing protein [Verrucomicrobiota bacterium]